MGTCVCQKGYFFQNKVCVLGEPCATGSTRQADGSCKCDAGLKNYGGFCSRCPKGSIWSENPGKCFHVCGQNSAFDTAANKCVCNPGFGLLNGVCDSCPSGYFISSGYCVTCPVNSVLNSASDTCECNQGYYTNQFGVCARKCGTNEEYDQGFHKCMCLKGLGRVNGACTVCPNGSKPAANG